MDARGKLLVRENMLFASVIVILGLSASAFAESQEENVIIGEVGKTVKIPINTTVDEGLVAVVWKRDEVAIVMIAVSENVTTTFDSRASLDPFDYGLTLKNLNFSDAGKYTIDVTAMRNSDTYYRSLKVLASPEVSVRVVPVVDDGSDVERVVAECYAKGGSDQFTTEWYEGDTIVKNVTFSVDSQNAEYDFLTDSSLPLIMIPNAASDNGRSFTCLVVDAFGRRIKKEAVLKVTEPTTTVPTTTMQAYPMIVKFPNQKSITIVMGKSRVLTCRATGVPEPTVSWYKDGSQMPGQVGEAKLSVLADDYAKSGTYRCEARSAEGVDRREVTISVHGAPVISGVDALVNETETFVLKPDDDHVQLKCESYAYPVPDIVWSIDDIDLDDMTPSEQFDSSEGHATSFLNISSRHFVGDAPVTKVICTASNPHGDATKAYLVSAPLIVAASNTGWIVGLIIGLLLLILVVVVIAIYCARARKRRGALTANPESGRVCRVSACCVDSKVKSKELEEEDDGVTVEHVKEVGEEGTQEEKQVLTQAEEEPAKAEETNGENNGADEGEAKEDDEPKKSKRKVPLPMGCCKGKKEKETENEENDDGQDADMAKDAENGDAKASEETERDSGKGDTLEKVLEDVAAQKANA